MKRDFTNENFEDFLKNSADSLRMKAPDKVWQNLSKELNKRRRRFTIGLGAFLLISSAVGYGVIGNLPEKSIASESPQTPTGKKTVSNETNKPKILKHLIKLLLQLFLYKQPETEQHKDNSLPQVQELFLFTTAAPPQMSL